MNSTYTSNGTSAFENDTSTWIKTTENLFSTPLTYREFFQRYGFIIVCIALFVIISTGAFVYIICVVSKSNHSSRSRHKPHGNRDSSSSASKPLIQDSAMNNIPSVSVFKKMKKKKRKKEKERTPSEQSQHKAKKKKKTKHRKHKSHKDAEVDSTSSLSLDQNPVAFKKKTLATLQQHLKAKRWAKKSKPDFSSNSDDESSLEPPKLKKKSRSKTSKMRLQRKSTIKRSPQLSLGTGSSDSSEDSSSEASNSSASKEVKSIEKKRAVLARPISKPKTMGNSTTAESSSNSMMSSVESSSTSNVNTSRKIKMHVLKKRS